MEASMAKADNDLLRADPEGRPPPAREGSAGNWLAFLLVAAAVAVGGWYWHSQQQAAPTDSVKTQPLPPEPAASAPHYPIEPADQPLQATEIPEALAGLVGRGALASFFQTDNFARRLVATIDNLGREHAPTAVWPVQPTAGRFTVQQGPDGPVLAPENAARYAPFVRMVEAVDAQSAGQLYRRMYPLLQLADRELGFGNRYLNDRVVAVIDQLLATPEPAGPLRLQLTEVKGPIPSTRPWVNYRFADPELESLFAGQKIMLRVGPENERRLKAKLREFRAQIAGAAR
jgi:hypothetical protein